MVIIGASKTKKVRRTGPLTYCDIRNIIVLQSLPLSSACAEQVKVVVEGKEYRDGLPQHVHPCNHDLCSRGDGCTFYVCACVCPACHHNHHHNDNGLNVHVSAVSGDGLFSAPVLQSLLQGGASPEVAVS